MLVYWEALCTRGRELFNPEDVDTIVEEHLSIYYVLESRHPLLQVGISKGVESPFPDVQHSWTSSLKGRIVKSLLFKDSVEEDKIKAIEDVGFYKKQLRIALRNCGVIDPEAIEEYIAFDGYKALATVLTEMKPEEVIETICYYCSAQNDNIIVYMLT